VKHASSAGLDQLEPLLVNLREIAGLRERGRGVFYRLGRAFLHFHENPTGLFADLRDEDGRDFERFGVSDSAGRARLLAASRARA
jgi:hypothetical protein